MSYDSSGRFRSQRPRIGTSDFNLMSENASLEKCLLDRSALRESEPNTSARLPASPCSEQFIPGDQPSRPSVAGANTGGSGIAGINAASTRNIHGNAGDSTKRSIAVLRKNRGRFTASDSNQTPVSLGRKETGRRHSQIRDSDSGQRIWPRRTATVCLPRGEVYVRAHEHCHQSTNTKHRHIP
jgi:hypothetical protein